MKDCKSHRGIDAEDDEILRYGQANIPLRDKTEHHIWQPALRKGRNKVKLQISLEKKKHIT